MYIYNANVITMAEKNYENGFILIEDIRLRTQDFLLILFSFVIAATGGMV